MIEWVKKENDYLVPVKSWCGDIEEGAIAQASTTGNAAEYRIP